MIQYTLNTPNIYTQTNACTKFNEKRRMRKRQKITKETEKKRAHLIYCCYRCLVISRVQSNCAYVQASVFLVCFFRWFVPSCCYVKFSCVKQFELTLSLQNKLTGLFASQIFFAPCVICECVFFSSSSSFDDFHPSIHLCTLCSLTFRII